MVSVYHSLLVKVDIPGNHMIGFPSLVENLLSLNINNFGVNSNNLLPQIIKGIEKTELEIQALL